MTGSVKIQNNTSVHDTILSNEIGATIVEYSLALSILVVGMGSMVLWLEGKVRAQEVQDVPTVAQMVGPCGGTLENDYIQSGEGGQVLSGCI